MANDMIFFYNFFFELSLQILLRMQLPRAQSSLKFANKFKSLGWEPLFKTVETISASNDS